jgi:hypothetical protein
MTINHHGYPPPTTPVTDVDVYIVEQVVKSVYVDVALSVWVSTAVVDVEV